MCVLKSQKQKPMHTALCIIIEQQKGEKQKKLDTYRKHFISIFDKNFSKYLFVKIFEKYIFFLFKYIKNLLRIFYTFNIYLFND